MSTDYFPNTDPPIPVPMLLTADETCALLRLDEERGMEQAQRALRRLVDRGVLRPCRVGPFNRYSREEIRRMIEDLTEISGAS